MPSKQSAKRRRTHIELLVGAIESLARSPRFNQFKIGFTRQSTKDRADDYRRQRFSHLVTLADKMTSKCALDLEEDLYRALERITDKRSILFRKWDPKQRKDGYQRSSGGRPERKKPIHSVYIAWCV